MAGMGAAPSWLARRRRGDRRARRKILVAIFQRGAADGLNIVVPFAEKRYYEMRPTIAHTGARRTARTARSTWTDASRCIRAAAA